MSLIETPDYTNCWYAEQLPTWTFLSHMLGGQDTVKGLTTEYLPQEPGELQDDYDNKLDRAVFFEDYRDCVVNLSGMVFRKPPKLATDVPVEIRGLEEVTNDEGQVTQQAKEGLAENIDNAGSHINVFLQRVFEEAFYGHTFIVVDMATDFGVSTTAQGIATAQDQQRSGARAYWCHRKITDALNWRYAVINGRTVLTQITFRECTSEPDGAFGETEVIRYRVYRINELGHAEWQLWEETDEKIRVGRSHKRKIVMIDSDTIRTRKGLPLKRLPIAVHYGEYEGFLKSRPPLKGIADINLSYYQKYADLTNIQHFTCAVTLVIEGDEGDEGGETLGGNRVLYTGMGQKAYFLEVNGESIPFLREDLRDLEKRMVHKGLDFVQEEHRVPNTATEVMLSYTHRTSKLAKMVRSLKDCAEQALSITAEMEGLDQGGSISVGIDENSLTLTPEQLRVYSEMNERGQMSLQTLWQIMGRADLLPENHNESEELGRLKEAALEQVELNAKQFDAGLESTP